MRRLLPIVVVVALALPVVAAPRGDKPREPFVKRFVNLILRVLPAWELTPPKP